MIAHQHGFVEGFLAAAALLDRPLPAPGLAESPPAALLPEPACNLGGLALSWEEYLEIPTFLRRGIRLDPAADGAG
ncbi:MAG: hypothetical protein AB1634_11035 [Thermodesulfobacteriota bacterium]